MMPSPLSVDHHPFYSILILGSLGIVESQEWRATGYFFLGTFLFSLGVTGILVIRQEYLPLIFA